MEGRKVKGRGYYILGTIIYTFFNAGVTEARMHNNHWMVLAELQGRVHIETAPTEGGGKAG